MEGFEVVTEHEILNIGYIVLVHVNMSNFSRSKLPCC
jgi:hypothetical protein